MIRPFLNDMTMSELHAVMTGGFATIAGSVLGAYISFGVRRLVRAAPCENVSSSICGRRRPRSDCASAQSDQGLRCPLTELLVTNVLFTHEQMPG